MKDGLNSMGNERFFESTRGQIVILLRREPRTVNDLAELLDLTDNAVRGHLATLERDRLVRPNGFRASSRKPNVVYAITPEAEALFPKAYATLFNGFLRVLKESGADVEQALRELGKQLGQSGTASGTVEQRVQRAVELLSGMGGLGEIERDGSSHVIAGCRCPFAESVPEHPEICALATEFLSQVIGRPVQEECDQVQSRCRFIVAERG
jgi:predicted ArsR family transcriptional regulator